MCVKSKKCLCAMGVHRTIRAGKHYDNKGHGLYLVVTPDGRKRWEQRITACGRRRTLGLGRYPDVSLSDARKRASRNCLLAFDGIDPIVHKRAQHRRVPTFVTRVVMFSLGILRPTSISTRDSVVCVMDARASETSASGFTSSLLKSERSPSHVASSACFARVEK